MPNNSETGEKKYQITRGKLIQEILKQVGKDIYSSRAWGWTRYLYPWV